MNDEQKHYCYRYPRPALTIDVVVFAIDQENNCLQVLLIERKNPPFANCWALPGGFVDLDETLEAAAIRELKEETGLEDIFLEQLYTFGTVDRDPRERVVSVAYYALVNLEKYTVIAGSDAINAVWFSMNDIPKLAFDHEQILNMAFERLQGKIVYQPIGFELLPEKFPLRQLQSLYEIILDRALDKRNFRKKILKMGFIEPLNEIETDVAHRAAQLYRFNSEKYQKLVKAGFYFEL